MPLPEDLGRRIKEVLGRRLGKEPLLIERVRPGLIGGVVVHVGDQRLDASLLTRIQDIRQSWRIAGKPGDLQGRWTVRGGKLSESRKAK